MPLSDALLGLNAVIDERYIRPAVSFGWRQAHLPPGTEVRSLVERLIVQREHREPISIDWATHYGAEVFTALLPQSSAADWMTELLDTTVRHGARRMASSIVGTHEATASMREAWQRIEPLPPHDAETVRSSMTQARAEGTTTITVTGPDPVLQLDGAATALAARLAEQVTQGLIPLLHSSGASPISVQMVRHLFRATPAVSWRIRSPHGRGLMLLESTLHALASQHPSSPAALTAARTELCDALQDSWRSPVELARALTRYEVMGWGAGLVRDPVSALNAPSASEVALAYGALLRPLAEVLGKT